MSGHNSGRTTSGQAAVGRGFRVQIPFLNLHLASILCSPGGPWLTRLLGFSNWPGDRLETTPGGRLGLSADHHSGRALSVYQDLCLATGVQGRY